jgi:hypothetical protein
MLWSQYKLATIIHTEFLRKQITGIPNFANQNSNFLTLQTSEFQKKKKPESLEPKTESEFRLQWGSQKLEPKIGIPNQGLLTLLPLPIMIASIELLGESCCGAILSIRRVIINSIVLAEQMGMTHTGSTR